MLNHSTLQRCRTYLVPISIALVGVLLRIALVPTELSTTDGINFALSLERFDLAQHQPHFPGYPLYVLCARGLHFLLGGGYPILALSLPSILATIPMIVLIHRALVPRVGLRAAWLSCTFVALAPTLVTVAALPRSDGFAASMIACAAALAAIGAEKCRPVLLLLAGLVAGLALGVRPSFAPLLVSLFVAWSLWNEPARVRRILLVAAGSVIGLAAWLVPFLAYVGLESAWQAGTVHTTGHFNAWGGTIATSQSGLLERASILLANSLSGLLVALAALIALSILHLRKNSESPLLPKIALLAAAVTPYAVWVLLAQNVDRPRHAVPLALFAALAIGVGLAKLASRTHRVAGALALAAAIGFPLVSSVQGALTRPTVTGRVDAVRWIGSELGIERVVLLGTQTPRIAHYYMPGLRTGLARHGADVLRAAERFQNTDIAVIVTSDVVGLEVDGLELEHLAQFSSTVVYAARTKPVLEVAGASL